MGDMVPHALVNFIKIGHEVGGILGFIIVFLLGNGVISEKSPTVLFYVYNREIPYGVS